MLELKNIALSFGGDKLYEDVTAFIGRGERIGLVGRNGAGKSTLFKIIMNELTPDAGQIDKQGGLTIGCLRQDLDFPEGMLLIDYLMSAQAIVKELEANLDRVQQAMEQCTDDDEMMDLAQELYNLQEQLMVHDAEKMEANAEKVAFGLGYQADDLSRPLSDFSGGWKMRAEIGRLLLQAPDLLLLDEPTNHLDIHSILWLEKWLQQYSGTIILISHDRRFLDLVTNRVWEISMYKLVDYSGTYSDYLTYRDERIEMQTAAKQNQDRKLKTMQDTVERFRAKANKAKMARSMEKMIQRTERIEVDEVDRSRMTITWAPLEHPGGKMMIEATGLTFGYTPDQEVISHLDMQIRRGEKIAFVGKNGMGKSTMAKLITGRIAPRSGDLKLGHMASPYYLDQYSSEALDGNDTLLETMERAGSTLTTGQLRSILGSFMFSGDDVHKKVKVLSGGEKNRLTLAMMIISKRNLLVLDEPTNHLDIQSREVLQQALLAFEGTLIVVSHDRNFLTGLCDRTYYFDTDRIVNYLGDVNYVLEQESARDMTELEINNKSVKPPKAKSDSPLKKPATVHSHETSPSSQPKAPTLSNDELRALKKEIRNIEQRILKLEKRQADIEADMAKADFYDRPDHHDVLAQYARLKEKIDGLSEEWERLAERM